MQTEGARWHEPGALRGGPGGDRRSQCPGPPGPAPLDQGARPGSFPLDQGGGPGETGSWSSSLRKRRPHPPGRAPAISLRALAPSATGSHSGRRRAAQRAHLSGRDPRTRGPVHQVQHILGTVGPAVPECRGCTLGADAAPHRTPTMLRIVHPPGTDAPRRPVHPMRCSAPGARTREGGDVMHGIGAMHYRSPELTRCGASHRRRGAPAPSSAPRGSAPHRRATRPGPTVRSGGILSARR